MPKRSIKFGVTNGCGHRASTWACTTQTNVGKPDVYIINRSIRGAIKVSLHRDGKWHTAYDPHFFAENLAPTASSPPHRFIERWRRPPEIGPGVTLAFRIITLHSAVVAPIDPSETRDMVWIQDAPEDKAIEVDIVITAPCARVAGWPGNNRVNNTRLAASMPLDSGETVWVVYWYIEPPTPHTIATQPNFYKGKGPQDLTEKSLVALVFAVEADGSRVVYECGATVGPTTNPPKDGAGRK